MTRSRRWVVIGLAIALFAADPALANFTCKVDPSSYIGVDSDGRVLVKVDNVGVLGICVLGSSGNGVNSAACQAWYSTLLTWRSTKQMALLYYNSDSNNGITSCSGFSAWGQSTPYYLESVG